MACNRKIAYKYNSYVIRKIPYIKIVELSKYPLSIAYGGKETN